MQARGSGLHSCLRNTNSQGFPVGRPLMMFGLYDWEVGLKDTCRCLGLIQLNRIGQLEAASLLQTCRKHGAATGWTGEAGD